MHCLRTFAYASADALSLERVCIELFCCTKNFLQVVVLITRVTECSMARVLALCYEALPHILGFRAFGRQLHFFASAMFVSKPCQFSCMFPDVLFRGCFCSCVAVTLVLEWRVGFVCVFVMVRLSQWVVVDRSALYIPVAHC